MSRARGIDVLLASSFLGVFVFSAITLSSQDNRLSFTLAGVSMGLFAYSVGYVMGRREH